MSDDSWDESDKPIEAFPMFACGHKATANENRKWKGASKRLCDKCEDDVKQALITALFGPFPLLKGRRDVVRRACDIRFEDVWYSVKSIVRDPASHSIRQLTIDMVQQCVDGMWWLIADAEGDAFEVFVLQQADVTNTKSRRDGMSDQDDAKEELFACFHKAKADKLLDAGSPANMLCPRCVNDLKQMLMYSLFGDFPWLTGRDRDIKRADKIRFETMWDNLQHIVSHTDDAVALYIGRKMLKECTDAKWWIKADRSGNVFHYFDCGE